MADASEDPGRMLQAAITNFVSPSGINFSFGQELPAATLSKVLCRIAAFLQDTETYGTKLYQYEDWWEHDGLHFSKGAVTFHDLFAMVESPRALLATMPGDDYVFVGIAPASGLWYLRFYLAWDEEGYELFGRCDLTLPPALTERFRTEVVDSLESKPHVQDADSYYRAIIR